MPKQSARPLDPRELARAIVEARLADAQRWMSAPDREDDSVAWDDLVHAVLAKTPGLTKQQNALIDFLDGMCGDDTPKGVPAVVREGGMGVVWGLADAHAEAGFLVGLELGRRMGGAR